MKLAEALIERAELQKINAQIIGRIKSNIKVQQGDLPAESPDELIKLYESNMERFAWLVEKINHTNNKTAFDGQKSIADAIARRDCLGAKIRAYREFYEAATIKQDRYNQNEIKFIRCVDAKGLQDTIDLLCKEYRELDTKLQGVNWVTDLIEHS